jgi:hypothetical protein
MTTAIIMGVDDPPILHHLNDHPRGGCGAD